MNRYMKFPLFFGMFWMLWQVLLYWSEYGFSVALLREAAFGFALGSVIGFIITLIHSQYVKRVARQMSEKVFDVHQTRTVLLHLPYERVFELCKESLGLAGRNNIKEEDREHGKIVAKTKPTLNYWGHDIISYDIQKVGEQLTKVEIMSKPNGRTTLIDNGRNLKRIEQLNDFLSERDAQLDIKAISEKLSGGITSNNSLNPTPL